MQTAIKPAACKYCGSDQHTSLMCFFKPRRTLRKVSNKSAVKSAQMRREWFLRPENAPNANGEWFCYLYIAPNCEVTVNRMTMNLEHVKSKVRHPELKFVADNLQPACQPCNKLKGSKDLEDLLEEFPHIQHIIDILEGR